MRPLDLGGGNIWHNPNTGGRGDGHHNRWGKGPGGGSGIASHKLPDRPCKYFLAGNECSYGERCRYPHSYCISDSIAMLTLLKGPEKGVTGIALPTGSDKLYSGSKDGTVRMWDCQTGQCAGVISHHHGS